MEANQVLWICISEAGARVLWNIVGMVVEPFRQMSFAWYCILLGYYKVNAASKLPVDIDQRSFHLLRQAQLRGLSIAFPVVIFGVVATLAGILMYWIPETLFSPMHQTIEETEAADDDYGIPCCGKKLQFPRPKSRQVIWL